MKGIFSFFTLLISSFFFSQISFDTLEANILVEIKHDNSGKYMKRYFQNTSSKVVYQYVADPAKFSFEVEEDVVRFLQKDKKKISEKNLNGVWALRDVNDFSGKSSDYFTKFKSLDVYEKLEFNTRTRLFTGKIFANPSEFMGCFTFNRKNNRVSTWSSQNLDDVIMPDKEGEKLPNMCLRSESFNDEIFNIYSLDSENLVLYKFISSFDNDEMEQTIFLHYRRVNF